MREDCVYGQARAFQGLGDTAPDGPQAAQHYEAALDRWRALLEAEAVLPADWWERQYNLLYCKYKRGEADEVRKAINAVEIMRGQPKDPALNKQWRDLKGKVGA